MGSEGTGRTEVEERGAWIPYSEPNREQYPNRTDADETETETFKLWGIRTEPLQNHRTEPLQNHRTEPHEGEGPEPRGWWHSEPNRGTYPNRTEHGELDVYFYYFVMTLLKTNSNSTKPEMQRKSK